VPAVEAPISEARDNQQLLSVLHDRHRPDVAQLRSIVAATLREAFARYHQRAFPTRWTMERCVNRGGPQ
jgi:hypothetical protein